MSALADILGKRIAAQVEIVPITSLELNARNPRINDRAVDAVAASIMRFGFNNPILVNAERKIVAGHTRYLAATKLGLEEVPIVILPHLTGPLFDAFAIADNQTASLSEWNLELLEEIVTELRGEDETLLADIGFDEPTLLELLREPDDFNADTDKPGSTRRLDEEAMIVCPHCHKSFKRSEAHVSETNA